MDNYRIIALETPVADAARAAAFDPIDLVVADAPHSFPCRHCLRDAEVGEPMLLFAHSPFAQAGSYKEVGPVWVHAGGCDRFTGSESRTSYAGGCWRSAATMRGSG